MQAWGCSNPGPRTGPMALFVQKQSPYCLFFQCPLYFLVSYFHKRWGTVGCSFCSSVVRLGVSPMCRGKWNLLPPILPPSFPSQVYSFIPEVHCTLGHSTLVSRLSHPFVHVGHTFTSLPRPLPSTCHCSFKASPPKTPLICMASPGAPGGILHFQTLVVL